MWKTSEFKAFNNYKSEVYMILIYLLAFKVVDLTENLRLSAELEDDPELERLPLTTDSSRVDQCVASLREVLGPLGE